MKIQCDVCERNAATVICCADEAALCAKCDVQVHAANKLASKHHRLQLHSLPTKLPSCDICQEKAAFIFCVEDRALFCQDCDESIHAVSTLAANHQRYLATGIRLALGCLSKCRNNHNNINDSETAHEEDPPQLQLDDVQLLKQQQQQQQQQQPAAPPNNNNNNNLSPPGSWGVDDLLEFPDFDSPTNNKKGEALEIGEIEWWSDMNLFGEQMQMGQELAAEVPQLPMSSSSSIMGIQSCNNNNNNNNNNGLLFQQQYRAAGGPTHKKPRFDISYRHDDDEYSIVPDLG